MTAVCALRFADGEEIAADLVVMAVGIRPNTELAESCGLHVDRGVVVSDTLQTYDPRIYAVGECVRHRGMAYGLVAPLFEQAKVAANHLALHGIGRYEGSVTSTKLKVTGIDVFSAGDFVGDGLTEGDHAGRSLGRRLQKAGDPGRPSGGRLPVWRYGRRRLVFPADPRGQGDRRAARPADVRRARRGRYRPRGREPGGGHGGQRRSLRLQRRLQGHHRQGHPRAGPVHGGRIKKHTKAASSCGSCTGLVEQILINCVGGAADVKPSSESRRAAAPRIPTASCAAPSASIT